MNKKKIIFTILLAFIISLSSIVVFAEDIANNSSTQDAISTINENANVIGSITSSLLYINCQENFEGNLNGKMDSFQTENFELNWTVLPLN